MVSLSEFGAETHPPVTTPATDDQGIDQCPVCDAHLDMVETAVIDIPVSTFASDVIADICRRGDVDSVRSRGDACGACGALFPHTVGYEDAAARGWDGHVGTLVERANGEVIRVPTRFEDFPAPLQQAINEVMRP